MEKIADFDLKEKVLHLITKDEPRKEEAEENLEKLASLVDKGTFFSISLEHVIQVKFPEQEAHKHWKAIIHHYNNLSRILQRDVGLKVSVLDYFKNIQKTIANPVIVDLHIKKQIEETSMVDQLTGLFNRTYFEIACNKELKRAVRYNKKLTLVIVKIDDFEVLQVNKGREFCESTLKKLAVMIDDVVRAEDILSRFERETFCFILPETQGDGAVNSIKRIQVELKQRAMFKHENITISAGVAVYPEDGETVEDLMDVAEQAVQSAQQQGKDTVVKSVSGIEKRKSKRFSMTWKVTFHIIEDHVSDFSSYETMSFDVSATGLSFTTPEKLKKGMSLVLTLQPVAARSESFKAVGIVRRVRQLSLFKYNYGIQFSDLSEGQMNKLKRLLPVHDVRM